MDHRQLRLRANSLRREDIELAALRRNVSVEESRYRRSAGATLSARRTRTSRSWVASPTCHSQSFGPSATAPGSAYLLLRLSALECLTSLADGFDLIRPLLTSAPRSDGLSRIQLRVIPRVPEEDDENKKEDARYHDDATPKRVVIITLFPKVLHLAQNRN
jgi:hypothetical protein